MLKRQFLCAVGLLLAVGVGARADTIDPFFSLRATANTATGPITQVNTVQGTANGGASFVNQYTSGSFPVTGDKVRTVAADIVTGYTTNPGGVIVGSGAPIGQKYTAVFIADGNVTVTGGTPTVTFASGSGRVFLFQSAPAGFTANDPTTWGISGSPVASWTVSSPIDIVPGNANANPNSFAAASVNSFTANAGAGNQAQGRIIFTDTSDPFLTVTDPLPPGFVFVSEGLYANISETVADPTVFPFGGAGNANAAAAIAALNQVAALAGLSNLGGANTGFATGFGAGGATNFNPSANFSTGDISFTLGLSAVPGDIGVPPGGGPSIPEPATVTMLGLMLGTVGIGRLIRRYRGKKVVTG